MRRISLIFIFNNSPCMSPKLRRLLNGLQQTIDTYLNITTLTSTATPPGASERSRVRLSELTLLMEDAWLSAHPQGDAGHRLSQFLATARFGVMQQVSVVLYCIVYCIVLYCIVLYCIVLYCIVLYCIVLYCTVLRCIVLYCIVLYCIVLYCIVLYCIVLYLYQHIATHFTQCFI